MALLLVTSATSLAQLVDVEGLPKAPYYSLGRSGDTLLAGGINAVYVSIDRGSTWKSSHAVQDSSFAVTAVMATRGGWFAGVWGRACIGVWIGVTPGRP